MKKCYRTRKGHGVQPVLFGFCAGWSALSLAADHPSMATDPLSVGSLLNIVLALSGVLGLFLVAIYLLRRFGRLQQGSAGKLQIVDGLALGPRDRLVLVQVGGDQVLLGVTPGNIQALHVLSEPLPSTFQTQLRETLTEAIEERVG